jgi:dTDP-4-dehydrorhamnose reductase
METLLITGSNGLLGQKLVAAFLNEPNWRVVASSYSPDRIAGKGYDFELLDITNTVEIDYIFDKYHPTVLVNTAAMTQVDTCETHQSECMEINVAALTSLSKACNTHKTHLIHLSSDFIFNGKRGLYKETDTPSPVNYYGTSKEEGEKLVMKLARQWSIVRTSLVYGVNPETARPNLVLWLRHALKEREQVRVNNDQFRTPTLAEDLAEGCRSIVMGKKEGIYNLAGNEYLSVLEVAHAVAAVFGYDEQLIDEVSSDMLNETGKRPLKGGLDISKARLELNYNPHSLESGLKLVKQQLEQARFSLDL